MTSPTITTRTFRERRAFLRWDAETAPIVVVSYSDRAAALTYLSVCQEEGREPRIANATGLYLKKDGSPGNRRAQLYVGSLDRLPDAAKNAALDALKGVSF